VSESEEFKITLDTWIILHRSLWRRSLTQPGENSQKTQNTQKTTHNTNKL